MLPAADDCISLLLGSRARYLEEHGAQPGTYYYTRGWVDFIDDPYKEYLAILPKYGEEKAAYVARLIMENYTRLAIIETPGVKGLEDKREYLETVSRFYDLPLEHLTGSSPLPREAGGGAARRGVHLRRARRPARRVPLLGALERLTPPERRTSGAALVSPST